MTEKLLETIKKFKNSKILVIGDLMLDEYIWGEVNRISPEAPIPVLDVKEITHLPGGAANTALNVKTLGAEVLLAGVIGNDEKGKKLKEKLAEKGIGSEGIFSDPQRKTTLKTRAVAKNQHIVRIDREDRKPINSEIENQIFNFVKERIDEIKAIIISDYLKGVVTKGLAENLIKLAGEKNVFSLVDYKGDDCLRYKNCYLITPNEKELSFALKSKIDSESQLLAAGKKLLAELSCANVLVKQGEKGMTLFERKGEVFHFPAVNKKARDVSGAGDTSIATLALSLASDASSQEAVILASHACGVAVSKIGTAVVFPEELERSIINNVNHHERKQS